MLESRVVGDSQTLGDVANQRFMIQGTRHVILTATAQQAPRR